MQSLLSPAWLLKHSLALIVLAMMLWLGFWQLDRLEQRRDFNAALLAARAGRPLDINRKPLPNDTMAFRPVQVSGRYDNAESIVLRNQSLDGVNGVHLITPLRIEGSDQAVLIDRGWLPAEIQREQNLAPYIVAEPVTVTGIAMESQERPDHALTPRDLPLPGEARIHAWLRMNIPRIEEQVGYSLLPFYIEQNPDPAAPANVLPRPRPAASLDEGPHLNYALQWFTFSIILLIVYSLLLRQELHRPTK
jgi:surfeit locus 1 family protein